MKTEKQVQFAAAGVREVGGKLGDRIAVLMKTFQLLHIIIE